MPDPAPADRPPKKKRRRLRGWLILLLCVAGILVAARLALSPVVTWYVNRALDENPLYTGKIGGVNIHLWRGAYTIRDIRLIKTTGDVPVPFFSSPHVDLAIQWGALFHGKVVGRIVIDKPSLNFVDSPDAATGQTGAGGSWLKVVQDLFPFRINRAIVHDGSIHFRTYHAHRPVDVYLDYLDATIDNLTNIRDETTPLISTVNATALAMDQAKFQFEMKLDPFAYRPTFHLALRLLGLDVTKVNNLARAYGAFDFEHGFFDLVVDLNARAGELNGYIKPLFRQITIISLMDVKEDNVLQLFWEALVGTVTAIFTNHSRDQFGTVVPISGSLENTPRVDLLATIGNVLRNAFIRAYLPRLEKGPQTVDGMTFEPAPISEPTSGDQP